MKRIIQELKTLSYADFVAFIGQQNTPPGGEETIETWIREGEIGPSSRILDLACTTGFSSRMICRRTGCRGSGLDLSELAIRQATKFANQFGLSEWVDYEVGDAASMRHMDASFTHIVGGSNFSFIQERNVALREVARVLIDRGRLLTSNYYYITEPPDQLLDSVEAVIDFRPSKKWTRYFWETFFSSAFELEYTESYQLPVWPESELHRALRKSIFQDEMVQQGYSEEVKDLCFDRLVKTRSTLNVHRRYQRYTVDVWRKRDGI